MVDAEIAELEAQLRSGPPLECEVAAMRLADAGREGARSLARVATDAGTPEDARVTAVRYLPTDAEAVPTLSTLLEDELPVLRFWALEKAERARAMVLLPLIEKLTHDGATFWDLDEEIVIAQVASRVHAALSPDTA